MTASDIESRLSDITNQIRGEILVRGFVTTAARLLVLCLTFLYFDALFRPEALILLILNPLLLLILVAVVYTGIHGSLAEMYNPASLAKGLERIIPSFQGRLAAAMEARGGEISGKWGYSNALRKEAVRIAGNILDRTRPDVVQRRLGIPERSASSRMVILGSVCLLALITGTFLSWPVSLTPSLERALNPLALYRAERTWDLEIYPGDVRLMKGEGFTVEIRPRRADPSLAPEIRVESDAEWTSHVPRGERGGVSYRFDFASVEERFRYYVTERKRRSPLFRVDIIEPPSVTALNFRIESPRYTGLPPREVGGDTRDLYAMTGAKVTLTGRVNKHLDRSYLLFPGGDRIELQLTGDRGLIGSFQVSEEDSFRIVVIDRSGIHGAEGPFYRIHVVDDRSPEVRVTIPGEDRELDREMEEVMRFRVADDFGLIDLGLQFTIESRSGEEKSNGIQDLVSFGSGIRDTVVDYRWNLKKLGLFPGDRVRYRGRVRDNDGIKGSKSGWSRQFVFTLPTMAEVFSRRQREVDETTGGIRDLVERSTRLREAIESLERDLSASGTADWEGRQEASDLLKQEEEILGELRDMANRFQERVEKLNREMPVSSRLLERAQEVSALFQEVATPEMMAAVEKLRQAIEKIDPKQVQEALEQLKFSEEELLKGLEKTLRALEQLRIEQDLAFLVEEATEILERQEAVNAELNEMDKARAETMRREEELISSDAGHLMKEMDRVSGEIEGAGEAESAEELENLAEEMADRGLENRFGEMAAVIEGGDFREAIERGEQLAGEMRHLTERLDRIRENLVAKWRRGIADAIDRAISDLLALSASQEDLYMRLPPSNTPLPDIDSFLSDQAILVEGLEGVAEKLFRSTEETFFIGRDVGRRVGSALHRMRGASRQLESVGTPDLSTRDNMKGAMAGINGAILALMRDRDSMMQSSSGAGFEEAFRQMMELAQSQAALNEKASGMLPLPLPGQSGGLSIDEQLLQMAAEQRRIQHALEMLESSRSGRSGGLGRIDHLIEEMEDVASDLEKGSIDEGIIERQRQILSRLLDAEKSLRERDYTRERQAERPEPYQASSPLPLPQDVFREDDLLDRSLYPMVEGSYPEGYRETIRNYFRELMRETSREAGP